MSYHFPIVVAETSRSNECITKITNTEQYGPENYLDDPDQYHGYLLLSDEV